MIPKILQLHWFWKKWPSFGDKVVYEWKRALPEWDVRVLRSIPSGFPNEFMPFINEPRIPPENKADLVRNWTMREYGGFYVDLDTRPVRAIDARLLNKKCFVPLCISYTDENKYGGGSVDSSFLGSEPGLVFWDKVLDRCWRPEIWKNPIQWFCGINTFIGDDNPEYVEFIPDLCQEATKEECVDFMSGDWKYPTRGNKYYMHYRLSGNHLNNKEGERMPWLGLSWKDVYVDYPVYKKVPEWV